ncbi:MAG TPA: FkbM family methyltransferase [Anaerolineales bacterium]|nr:FkbM family methyltransferase [Anaerolineales bacterium]
MTFVSYSQNLEDVMLWRALKHIDQGFYVDVGANDPNLLSITRAFYERGWHGINIDPATYELLIRERVRDINLGVAVGSTDGEVTFFEVSNSALSTNDPELAEYHRQSGQLVIEKKVSSLTLNQILETHAQNPIHFMNIDVEGAELQVLKGLDLTRWRPWIILIEATIPTTETPAFEEWEPPILSANYEFVYSDGLNRFYLAKEHHELESAFGLPPNIFDHYALSSQIQERKELEAKEEEIQALKSELDARGEVIHIHARELKAKEEIIQAFQTSYFFWLVNGPLRWLPRIRVIASRLQNLRRIFLPKIGVLEQHPPKPLFTPKSYNEFSRVIQDHIWPSISIVTPSYNQGKYIERTIRSVLDQGYPQLQYVIQDGNSSDNTLDIIQSFQEKLFHVEARKDNGQAHAINLGFHHTSGEIMAYLNSDDVLLPGTLRYVADYFARHHDIDVVYGHRVIIDENDQEIGRWILPPHDPDVILWADYIPQETLFWRRSLWEKIGGSLDESYRFALDWDLIVRFHNAGAKFSRLPRFLGAFRLQAEQKTSMQINSLGLSEMNRLRNQIHGREVSLEEINKNIIPYLKRSLNYHRLYRLGILRY